MSTYSSGSDVVWVSLGGMVLLEELHHWRQVLGVYGLTQHAVHFLCLVPASEEVSSQFPATMPATCCHASLP